MRIDRRRFLARAASLVASGLALRDVALRQAIASGDPSPSANTPLREANASSAPPDSPGGAPDLVIAKGPPKDATRRALDALGGIGRFVHPGETVVLKPNAGFDAPPGWGATTHPEVVSALVESCLDAGARRVLVLDHTLHPAERCFARSGIAEAVAPFAKAKLVSLDDRAAYTEVPVPMGKALRKTEIPIAVAKADVLINIPAAKAHSATRVSLGLKNLMGLVWDRHVFHQEIDLEQGIADLATVLRPALTILSAVTILKTGGPAGPGETEPFGGVIAGIDPVAVDSYGVTLSTWNRETLRPEQIGYIRHASEHGIGEWKLDQLRIVELS
ncbi:MAG: DUF362 domain-containing protein [Candidatus Eisenbacteria bacterium]|nr:DUF362 domain-containing protein [Candidatus Eisenbacteria bacterium]